MTRKMTDDDHIRYMLSLGSRTIVKRLHETDDAWSFGGPTSVCKDRPLYRDSEGIHRLDPETRFYVSHFALKPKDAGLLAGKVHGVALWFQWRAQLPTHELGESRALCGWVPVEREADLTGWVTFVNGEIQARLREAAEARAVMTDDELDAESNAHLQHSLAFFNVLGVPMPQAATMDEFMDKLKEAAAVGPIDLRRPEKP